MKTKVYDIYAEDRFPALRIFRWILFVFGGLMILSGLYTLIKSDHAPTPVILGIIAAIIMGLMMICGGEMIKLLIDMEENGRLTNHYLRYLCEDREQEAARRAAADRQA